MNIALALLFHAVAAFETRTFPLEGPDTDMFLGPAAVSAAPCVYLLDGSTLTAYALGAASEPARAVLPEGVTAFDVADVDDDRSSEVIAVAGKRILRIPFTSPPSKETVLFEDDGVLSKDTGQAYLFPLAVRVSDRNLIALLREDSAVLFSPAGEAVMTVPLRYDDSLSDSFGVYTEDVPFPPSPHAFQMNVWRRVKSEPELPENSRYSGAAARDTSHNRSVYARSWEEDMPASEWPWFPVKDTGAGVIKAHFSRASQLDQTTIINIRNPEPRQGQSDNAEYRYPGVLVSTWEPPDFNGDGYGDLLLARIPEPGGSIEGVVRTLTNASWSIDLAVHVYVPDKGRFDPRPMSVTRARISVMNILDRGPLGKVVLRDFNGDGRTDLGISPDKQDFRVWLCGEKGLPKEPEFSYALPEPLQDVEFEVQMGGKGCWGVGLRTEHSLVVVNWVAP